jgi:hypothetical protein
MDPAGTVAISCGCRSMGWYDPTPRRVEVDCRGLASTCCPDACGPLEAWSGDWDIIGAGPSDEVSIGDAFCDGAVDGGQAWCDGLIPLVDPFADNGFYDPTDPTLQVSVCCGTISRDCIALACGSGGGTAAWGTWCRNPALYERGCTTVPLRVWQQIKHLDPLARGRWLTEHGYGYFSGFFCRGGVSQCSKEELNE